MKKGDLVRIKMGLDLIDEGLIGALLEDKEKGSTALHVAFCDGLIVDVLVDSLEVVNEEG